MDRLQSFGILREVDPENGRVTAVIATGDVARDDAIIDPSGWDFSNYDRNPVVLWGHMDFAMPVARTVERLATDSELIAKAEFDLEDPEGSRLFSKIQRGFVSATSVRWLPKRWEYRKLGSSKRETLVFLEQELLEWSFVSVPADPKAIVIRADGSPLDVAAFGSEQRVSPAAPPLSESRDAILDDIDYLRASIDQYGIPDLAKRIGDDGLALARGLHERLTMLLGSEPIPEPSEAIRPQQGAETLSESMLERLLSAMAASRARPSAEDTYVKALVIATGKSEERVRRELAEGVYA